jgi:hypothetical protein
MRVDIDLRLTGLVLLIKIRDEPIREVSERPRAADPYYPGMMPIPYEGTSRKSTRRLSLWYDPFRPSSIWVWIISVAVPGS